MTRSYISILVVRRVREAARDYCGYCRTHQDYNLIPFEIEHIIPLAEGSTDDEENLWLACSVCNGHKSDKTNAIDPDTGEVVPLFNPRTQGWRDHFKWSDDSIYIIGLTPIGRATVEALHFNDNDRIIRLRKKWIDAKWHPPKD